MSEKKSLYHKYRPNKLKDLIGQDHVVKTLTNAVSTGRLRHAYLFTGLRGIGKTSIARILALIFNCDNGPSVEYDINSSICKSIISGTCPDVIELDAASNSSIDEIRELRNLAKTNPVMGKKKIFIIDEVHCLRKDAASALLKILEEPPKNTIFILATTDSQKLLKTILSRCQRFDLKRISNREMIPYLRSICEKEGVKVIENDALDIIARAGMGSVRDCLSLLDAVLASSENEITVKIVEETISFTSFSFFYQLIEYVISGERTKAILHLKKALVAGKDPQEIFYSLLEYLHSTVLSKNLKQENWLYIESSIKDSWKNQRDNISIDNFITLFKIVENYLENISNKPRVEMSLDICVLEMIENYKK